jgi:hypothetical protein
VGYYYVFVPRAGATQRLVSVEFYITAMNIANIHLTSDVFYHGQAEMNILLANCAEMEGREQQFLLRIHTERVASGATALGLAKSFDELTNMAANVIIDVHKLDVPIAKAMHEVLDLVNVTFMEYHAHALRRESTVAKDFEKYSEPDPSVI